MRVKRHARTINRFRMPLTPRPGVAAALAQAHADITTADTVDVGDPRSADDDSEDPNKLFQGPGDESHQGPHVPEHHRYQIISIN